MATSYWWQSDNIVSDGSAPGAMTIPGNTPNNANLVFYHYSRTTTGSVTAPSGFTTYLHHADSGGLICLAYKTFVTNDPLTYTATVSGHNTGTSGDSISEIIFIYQGMSTTQPLNVVTDPPTTNASQNNVGAINPPRNTTIKNGDSIKVVGGKRDNFNALGGITTGDSLTWDWTVNYSTTSGADIGLGMTYGRNASGSDQTLTSKTLTDNSNASEGKGVILVLRSSGNEDTFNAFDAVGVLVA